MMNTTRIKVPEDMLTAVLQSGPNNGSDYDRERDLEIALRCLTENPIVPTDEQMEAISQSVNIQEGYDGLRSRYVEFQRRMFVAPEPEVPEAIEPFPKYLFFEKNRSDLWADEVNARMKLAWTEAYRRGQRNPK